MSDLEQATFCAQIVASPRQQLDGIAMSNGEKIFCQAEDGAHLQLRAPDGAVGLTQTEIAHLYGSSRPNVQQTIARVLADGEVDESISNSELMVRTEGARQVRREVKVYNLDMVLADGYRSTSPRAVNAEFDGQRSHGEALEADTADLETLRAIERKPEGIG